LTLRDGIVLGLIILFGVVCAVLLSFSVGRVYQSRKDIESIEQVLSERDQARKDLRQCWDDGQYELMEAKEKRWATR